MAIIFYFFKRDWQVCSLFDDSQSIKCATTRIENCIVAVSLGYLFPDRNVGSPKHQSEDGTKEFAKEKKVNDCFYTVATAIKFDELGNDVEFWKFRTHMRM